MPTCSCFLLSRKLSSLVPVSLMVTLSALVLSACVPPSPGVHEVLKISEQGGYTFNGVAIPREQLRETLAAERLREKKLYAEIVVSPRSDIEDVKFAVDALKATQVRFAFIDEQIMNSGKQKITGDSMPN